MEYIIYPGIPNLDTVRKLITTNHLIRLPHEVLSKLPSNFEANFSPLKDLPLAECINVYNPVHRIALIIAASDIMNTKPEIAADLISVINCLPSLKIVNDPSFNDSIFDVEKGCFVTDELFSSFIKERYSSREKEILKYVQKPYASAALVLVIASLMERLSDYALITLTLKSDINCDALISSEMFSRESAPLHVSLVAQRIFEIALNSKNLKKSGSNALFEVPRIFAPIYTAISIIRTSTSKPQHFYEKCLISSNLNSITFAASFILDALENHMDDLNPRKLLVSIAHAIYAISEKLAHNVEQMIANKKLTVGTISKDFSTALLKEGPSLFSTMRYFYPPEGEKIIPKEPSGTRDLLPKQMKIRDSVIGLVASIFRKHGAVNIDTPVFELRSVLTEKYGEESKLIYNLEDQGGELLSLRYDLTVPFARFIATHGVKKIKRYHIAKVYRRDKPAIDKGRFREFYQCDFDIAGDTGLMISDAEVISIVCELLDEIGKMCNLTDFKYSVRVSHRELLTAITKLSGIPDEKFKTVCSSIDKLDKSPWQEVEQELVHAKGISLDSALKLKEYVSINGSPFEVIKLLKEKNEVNSMVGKILDDMNVLFGYIDSIGCLDKISFDLSLARGLDYYTGVIYEACAHNGGVGSIAGGGRYDGLIGMFSRQKIPAVGVSLGIERVFTLIERSGKMSNISESDTKVFIVSIAEDYTSERFKLASAFWKNGIPTEMFQKQKPNIRQQLLAAEASGAIVAVTLAPEEMSNGNVKIRQITKKDSSVPPIEKVVPLSKVVEETLMLIEQLQN